MTGHLPWLVALDADQWAAIDARHAARQQPPAVVAPVEQPARLRVHDLPRDVVRGLAGVLGVRQHGRDLAQLRDAVEEALVAAPSSADAA